MIEHLKNIPLFKTLSEDEFTSIHDKLEEINFAKDTLVFEAGEIGDCIYIIVEGKVEVYIEIEVSGKLEKVFLSNLEKGDYFGEMSLITGEPRSASVITLTECELLRLSKSDFDQLIMNNTSITLSLTHMLSQRLKSTNIKMAKAESVFQSKINTKGKLNEQPLIEVLKFCEQNSLTGVLKLNNNDEDAELEFLKGQLQEASYKGLSEDEVMDEILNWEKGTFEIEPKILKMNSEKEQSEPQVELSTEKNKDADQGIEPIDAIKYFSENLINRLITIVGSRVVQDTFDKIKESTSTFFPDVKGFNLKLSKGLKLEYKKKSKLNDKDYLALGVFLQLFLEDCKQHTLGMSFLDINDLSQPHKDALQNVSFFEYMSHAKEFVQQ